MLALRQLEDIFAASSGPVGPLQLTAVALELGNEDYLYDKHYLEFFIKKEPNRGHLVVLLRNACRAWM